MLESDELELELSLLLPVLELADPVDELDELPEALLELELFGWELLPWPTLFVSNEPL